MSSSVVQRFLLQDGFAARHWLDYHSGLEDENKALLVGNALVNGHKAFLDVKQKVDVGFGCHLHAWRRCLFALEFVVVFVSRS